MRQSAIDGRLLKSLTAWDSAGLQHDPAHFAKAIAGMSLGFNFHYVDDHGHIGYWHTGRYPIRPRNVDPRLPIPGDARFDWQGFERFADQPHAVDPRSGFIANWNNKPASGWWSKNLETGVEGGLWGDGDQVADLQAVVRARIPLTYATMGLVPHDVAYTDNRARYFKPALLSALRATSDPTLEQVTGFLSRWNAGATSSTGRAATPRPRSCSSTAGSSTRCRTSPRPCWVVTGGRSPAWSARPATSTASTTWLRRPTSSSTPASRSSSPPCAARPASGGTRAGACCCVPREKRWPS